MLQVLSRFRHHLEHLSYAAGRARVVGSHRFRMQGYFPNKFSRHDRHEQHLTLLFARLLKQRPGAFVDVGVNLGQTLCKVLSCDTQRQYVGFEPQLACCFYVSQFIRTNALASASVFPVALGRGSGFLTLHAASEHDEMASLLETALSRPKNVHTSVPVVRGDDALEQIPVKDVCAIKIDVEGAELDVLLGLERTLTRHRPAVVFEVQPNYFGSERLRVEASVASMRRARATELLQLLTHSGYAVSQVLHNGDTKAIDRFELDEPKCFVGVDYVALA